MPATISRSTAAAGPWHAIVVGAGPAGAAVASRLALRGLRVLLLDAAAMPRPKLCGCCLSTAALNEFKRLDELAPAAGPALPPATLPLTTVRLATAGGSALVPLPGGGVVSRETLDVAGVRRAIATGVAWLPSTRVAAVREGAAHEAAVTLTRAAGATADAPPATLTAGLVVMASGLSAAIRVETAAGCHDGEAAVTAPASRIGVGATLAAGAGGPPRGELVMAVAAWGYCGLVRLEDDRLDLAAAVDRSRLAAAGSPAAAVAAILAETGSHRAADLDPATIDDLFATATFRGTPPLTRSQPVATASGRIVRVGDAAGYVEPFTGEGMGWALASARLCDEAYGPVLEPGSGAAMVLAAAGRRYAALHARHFAIHHARCRRVALAVRSPWLVGSAVRLARLAPAVAARVAPLVVGAAVPRKGHG